MKLTKSQERKLRKKLKLRASAEDIFVDMFMSDVKKEIGKKIQNAKTLREVDIIISDIDVKNIKKYAKNLRNKVLVRNNTGFAEIIKAMTQGLNQIKQKRKENEKFNKEMKNLIKNQGLTKPLLDIFERNMSLIKNLPTECYDELRKGYLQGKSFRGTELEEKLYEKLGKRAKLIVRTESAKVNTAITEVRSRSLGVKGYIWSSSGDARVRDTHHMLDGVLIFWDDAPTFMYTTQKGEQSVMVGHCGETPNCRCISIPIVYFEDIKFPVKVAEHVTFNTWSRNGKSYSKISGGKIQLYNKQQFLLKYGDRFLSPAEIRKQLN